MKDWEQLRDLFEEAWPLVPAERALLLEARCAGNPKLRIEAERLLEAYDQETRASSGGRRFGAWEASELVGRGGMAEVYLAHRVDGHHEQRAAVKVMARNLLAWDFMERFRREREILGRLEHPNIARLLDGGVSAEGEPFLVMEYVDGLRLDDYCRQKQLSLTARLHLFLSLCSAVESAHRNLILHRDIKPSNVLVTADGTLKLVDFGAARRMDGGSLVTMAPLTPSFASPEQLRGEAVTTLSDVYGLGITLYKLLTGVLPFEKEARSAYEMARAVVDRTPPLPSSAPGLTKDERSAVRGDLDNIVLKAIDSNPASRYASAERLAADIRRHLEKRPVEARPRTWSYRAERFVARNRLGVGLAAVSLLILAAAGIALTLQIQHTRAQALRNQRLADFLTQVMGLRYDIASGPLRAEGRAAHMVDAIRYASRSLSAQMADQPELEARLRGEIGHALAELGYYDEAEDNLARGLELLQHSPAPALAAEIKGYLARNAYLTGNLPRASKLFHEARQEMAAARPPASPAVESLLLINAAGVKLTYDGLDAELWQMIERALMLSRKVGLNSPSYALALFNHGSLLNMSGKADAGEQEIRQGLAIDAGLTPQPLELCVGQELLGSLRMRRGDFVEARQLFGKAHPCEERTLGAQSSGLYFLKLAEIELAFRQGDRTTTLPRLEEWERDMAAAYPKGPWMHALGAYWRGRILCTAHRPEEGRPVLEQALVIFNRDIGPKSPLAKDTAGLIGTCK